MSLKGMPDWSNPLKAPGGGLYFAYNDPLRALAMPLSLDVAEEPNGAPAMSLEVIRLNGAADGPKMFSLLTIRFAAGYAIADRQASVFAIFPNVRVEPLASRGGFLRFTAAGALDLPDDLLEPRPLVWAGAGSLTFAAQIGQSATRLFNETLLGGLTSVTALAELETWGVASRAPASVTFDPAAMAQVVSGAAPYGKISAAALSAALVESAGTRDFYLTDIDSDDLFTAAIGAFTERLIGRYGKLAPANDPRTGAAYTFDVADMGAGRIAWDLNEAVLVPRAVTVASYPLETARQALTQGFGISYDAPAVSFASGLHVVSIYPNLPPKRVGAHMVGVEICAPPFPPYRPQTVTASAMFREGETMKTVNLRLSPLEPLEFGYQSVSYISAPGGVRLLTGPETRHAERHLTVAPDSFPVRFIIIEAAKTLLEAAIVKVKCTGTQDGKPWSIETELKKETGAIAIAAPRDVEDGTMELIATTHDGSRIRRIDGLPLEDRMFEMYCFPTAGPAMVSVACEFDDDAGLAAIELAPEDRVEAADAAGLVWLTPGKPLHEWRWLVVNPLFDGYRWRWSAPAGETPHPWSEPVGHASGQLALRSSQRPGFV